jgi:sialidase-1
MTYRTIFFTFCMSCTLPLHAAQEHAVFVDNGQPNLVYTQGAEWKHGNGYLECSGTERYLVGQKGIGPGDFQVTVELTILNLRRSAASFVLGHENHFGFDGGHDQMFVEGRLFGDKSRPLGPPAELLAQGKPVVFEAVRTGEELKFLLAGKQVFQQRVGRGELGPVALRPWRSTMRVRRFEATGQLFDLPEPEKLLPRTQPDAYTIPTIDLSHQGYRQVVIARGTAEVYQGHPHTLLLPDGKTMFAVWTQNHGGPCGPMKCSDDGGLTWGDLLPVPENWSTVRNCPTIHRLVDPQGKPRLFVLAGAGAMYQSVSLDEGRTWSPMTPNGLTCIVAPITIVPIAGQRLLAMYHRGSGDHDRPPLTLWQAISADGGLTWGDQRQVAAYQGGAPCEPFVVRSPDGKQLAALARENARNYNSLLITSNDEGRTWSKPVELPASLTGDRHMGRYAPDGRLVICFRDTTLASPTHGDFVAWVGTYDDIVKLQEGQYRVRLLRSPKKGDLGYPGVEVLPDGTFVATTYAVLAAGEKNSVVSIRFSLKEIDQEAARLPQQVDVYKSGRDGYNTYRIPALVVTKKGTVLAFCEGRKDSGGDTGDIDILLKRSADGGKTFSAQQVVWDDGPNTCGNPCPVVDRETGSIWLLLTQNLGTDHEHNIITRTSKGTRTVWVSKSDDDGVTWSNPVEITKDVKRSDWTWYATGPGAGIQLKSGRLVIPCDHIESESRAYYSHVIFSDDHGATWKLGGMAGPATNECETVELADGTLLLNMRNYDRRQKARAVARSSDGGATWSAVAHDDTLVEPVCQASIRRYRLPSTGQPGAILFSNPAETGVRKELTIRLSRDEGHTWPVGKVLWPGPAAYSCLATLPDGTILCLYERGLKGANEKITLGRFSLEWLLDGR